MKMIKWGDHLVNLFVVILGITIAFGLNNWKESRDQKKLEISYLKNINNELKEDLSSMKSNIQRDSILLANLNVFLNAIPPISDDSINTIFSSLFSITLFIPNNLTFESMKASGKFDYITKLETRNAIIDLYHNQYRGISESENYFRDNLDKKIIPFIMENSDFENDNLSAELFPRNNKKFNNMLLIHRSMVQLKMNHILSSIEKGEKLVQIIENNIDEL
ncbi:MAG: DUF6090 family protein [Cyclobacteriaceae bacterium]|nr:DUF6090 family protein [Cyclobacteriaceae bacterium]